MRRHKNVSMIYCWPDNKSNHVEFPAIPLLNEFISISRLVKGHAKDLMLFYRKKVHIRFISLTTNSNLCNVDVKRQEESSVKNRERTFLL